jgi:UDP-N-acetylglucosamine--N-acetylmuramyl-(pentapeptide) pyrophosphoryl-undecaprenol N-acetylglucosamine transferase
MKILAVGGGSGGHVTPVVAVIKELKKLDTSAEIHFWCDRKFARQATALMSKSGMGVPVSAIFSGKLRRYHGIGLDQQLLDLPTLLQNIGDIFLVVLGFLQSIYKLLLWRPDVIFTKGGFVCLPVGMAAKVLGIPLVIHDSDAHPGMTNRILSRWATRIATGAPLEYYPYPKAKSQYVGIPVSDEFKPLTETVKKETKARLGLPDVKRPLVVVTGGGLGAKRINDAMVSIGNALLEHTAVVHISGALQYESLKDRVPQRPDYQLLSFVDHGMAKVLGAADVVVTRAGATTMLELAALARPTIIVPNGQLTGGHQLKNAKVYEEAGAAEIVREEDLLRDPRVLQEAILELLSNRTKSEQQATRLRSFAKPEAAHEVAMMIMKAGKGRAVKSGTV